MVSISVESTNGRSKIFRKKNPRKFDKAKIEFAAHKFTTI